MGAGVRASVGVGVSVGVKGGWKGRGEREAVQVACEGRVRACRKRDPTRDGGETAASRGEVRGSKASQARAGKVAAAAAAMHSATPFETYAS